MFNTPVLRDGWLYGISGLNALFCVNAETGESAWSAPLGQPVGGALPAAASGEKKSEDAATGEKKAETPAAAVADQKADDKKSGPGGPPGGPGMRGGKGMRGGMGGGGYGSVVDAGSVLVALNPTGQLIVFEPNEKEFKQIASYKVADSDAYAYPILAGNQIFVKDKDSVILWTIE
jgi:outer membrane protein assembly factor BamB